MALLCSLLKDSPSATFPLEYDLPSHEWPGQIHVGPWGDLSSIHFAPPRYDFYTRPRNINEIITACLSYGIFEVVNHELSEDVMNNALRFSAMYFDQPSSKLNAFANETCKLYSGSAAKAYGLERESYWRDTLTMMYNTGFPARGWPTQPPCLKRDLWQFATEVSSVETRILRLISEGLGLSSSFFNSRLVESSSICVNHFPICMSPTRTIGFPKHGEPNLITISLEGEIPGLQIYTNGQWKSVVPSSNALLVRVGYQMEIVTNGQIKAPQLRVVVDSTRARTTVSYKTAPSDYHYVEPALGNALYKKLMYGDFLSYYNSNRKDTDTITPYILR